MQDDDVTEGPETPAEALANRLAELAVEASTTKRGGRKGADAGAVAPHAAAEGWNMNLTAEWADVSTGGMEAPIQSVSDWDGVLRFFGLDPAEFEIVDDTVRMGKWQQSKGLEDGTRSTVWLYSYRARFARTKRIPATDLEQLRKTVARWKPARRSPGAGLGTPSTLYVGWADWQLGKGEGRGVEGTTQRVLDSFEQTEKRLKDLRRIGRNVTSISVWNMGDPSEGCDGQYANQPFVTELNRRQQLGLGLQLWLTGLRALAPLVDDFEFGSVLCNHGEWSRQGPGTKPVTDDSDNVGGYLAETLRTVLADRPGFDHVRYSIPHDEMTMLSDMSGIPVALAHGHKMPGTPKEMSWLQGESIRLLRERGREPRLWMTAHRHHYSVTDYGAWHRIQHPSLDFGSKHFTDYSGKWSVAGTFTALIGEHAEAGGSLSSIGARGFSDELVLAVRS